jgi:hypothetical protein
MEEIELKPWKDPRNWESDEKGYYIWSATNGNKCYIHEYIEVLQSERDAALENLEELKKAMEAAMRTQDGLTDELDRMTRQALVMDEDIILGGWRAVIDNIFNVMFGGIRKA